VPVDSLGRSQDNGSMRALPLCSKDFIHPGRVPGGVLQSASGLFLTEESLVRFHCGPRASLAHAHPDLHCRYCVRSPAAKCRDGQEGQAIP